MDIALIVCTRNRCRKLHQCLAHVGQIAFQGEWELVVVDNGSDDETSEVIMDFAAEAPFSVRLVREPRPGLAIARNTGLAHARGDIIAFTDDDCYPERDYLDQIWRIFMDPAIGYIGGRVLLYDSEDAAVTIRADTRERRFPPRSFIRTGSFHGANMAFRRSVAEAIQGFDPSFGAGMPLASAEDTDFFARASAAGFLGGYFPAPVVYHHHGRKPGRQVTMLRRGHDIGRGAYYAKFLFQRQTVLLYAAGWFGLVMRKPSTRLFREIYGAVRYGIMRITESFRHSADF